MWFDPNPFALAHMVPLVVLGALALIVSRSRPNTAEKRRLAAMLGAIMLPTFGLVLGYGVTDPILARASYGWAFAGWAASFPAALRFLATFNSPLSRWLRTPIIDRVLLGAIVAAPLLWVFALRDWTIHGVIPFVPFVPWRPAYTPSGYNRFVYAQMAVALFTIAVMVDTWRRAPQGPTRSRMGTYTLGMAVAEVLTVAGHLLRRDLITTVASGSTPPRWQSEWVLFSWALTYTGYCAITGYAVLKSHLFDIDLKLKWTLRRGTLVGAFVGAFFVVTAIAEQWLQQYGVVAGGAAVGMMLFAVRPLERAADRLANTAMPHVNDTAEYQSFRKLEVYKAAVEELMVGGLTPKERRALEALAGRMGIGAANANAIERDLFAAQAVAG